MKKSKFILLFLFNILIVKIKDFLIEDFMQLLTIIIKNKNLHIKISFD